MTHFDPLKPCDGQKFHFLNQDGGQPMPGMSVVDAQSEPVRFLVPLNAIEDSVCAGDAALCQIILTTCCFVLCSLGLYRPNYCAALCILNNE